MYRRTFTGFVSAPDRTHQSSVVRDCLTVSAIAMVIIAAWGIGGWRLAVVASLWLAVWCLARAAGTPQPEQPMRIQPSIEELQERLETARARCRLARLSGNCTAADDIEQTCWALEREIEEVSVSQCCDEQFEGRR